MITHFSELHQNIDDTHEMACGQCLLSCGLCHEVIVETALALGEPAANNVLVLFRHLLLNIHFNSAQQKWSQNLVEAFD